MLLLLQNLIFEFQGNNYSHLEKEIGSDQLPANEHYFGLVNVSFMLIAKYVKFVIDRSWLFNLPVF